VRWRHVAAAVALTTTGAACASTPRGEGGGVSSATRYDARASQTRATGTAGRDRGAATPAPLVTGLGTRSARWSGTYAPGAARARALTLRLTDGGGGTLGGELSLLVAPRASTFAGAGAAGPAPVRVTVPLARGHYADGRLVLDTDAYYDAACECTVTTTYRAQVRGDTLSGTFATRGPATAATVRGRWRVVRLAADRP
jgi:hypothetical protein